MSFKYSYSSSHLKRRKRYWVNKGCDSWPNITYEACVRASASANILIELTDTIFTSHVPGNITCPGHSDLSKSGDVVDACTCYDFHLLRTSNEHSVQMVNR